MKHTTQMNIIANKIRALLANDNVKEAIAYAKRKGITPVEFGKISKNWVK